VRTRCYPTVPVPPLTRSHFIAPRLSDRVATPIDGPDAARYPSTGLCSGSGGRTERARDPSTGSRGSPAGRVHHRPCKTGLEPVLRAWALEHATKTNGGRRADDDTQRTKEEDEEEEDDARRR